MDEQNALHGWQKGSFRLRANLVYSAFLLGAATLAAHLFFLQYEPQIRSRYLAEVEKRWHSYECPQGRRGNILYRDGTLIAGTRKVAKVLVEPALVKDLAAVCATLGLELGLDPDAVAHEINTCSGRVLELESAVPINAALAIDRAGLRGVFTRYYFERDYPHGKMGAPATVGYAGRQPELRIGIERFCDAKLTGRDGRIVYRKDARRQRLPGSVILESPRENGADITTTLHPGIQTICEDELASGCKSSRPEWACAVVMDPETGEILGASTYPAFDPNEYVKGNIGTERNVLVHSCVEPGSTVKPLLVAYALDRGWLEADQRFRCDRLLTINGYTVREAELDHVLADPGGATLGRIISQSSNIGMAQVALQLGQDRVSEAYRHFGFFQRSGVELPGERKGSPPPDKTWPRITIANTGFGQGFTVTPLQLATAFCALANGGRLVKPHLLLNSDTDKPQARPEADSVPEGEELIAGVFGAPAFAGETAAADSGDGRRILSAETCSLVNEWLKDAVNKGTGKKARLALYQSAGKTGTGQIAGRRGYAPGAYTATFAGYFPADSPRYMVLVLFSHPRGQYYGGQVAAPVFKAISDRISYMDQLQRTRSASEAKNAPR